MGRLNDWLEVFEADAAQKMREVIESDDVRLVDADEVCFYGAPQHLPPSMEYLRSMGTPVLPAEVYIVGIKDGHMIGPEIWFADPMRERLEELALWLQESLARIVEICDEEGFGPPTVIKSAIVVGTDEAFTKYEFDPLPRSPVEWATAADLAFDAWTQQIEETGSAYKLIKK
jgi:hypothetical protein